MDGGVVVESGKPADVLGNPREARTKVVPVEGADLIRALSDAYGLNFAAQACSAELSVPAAVMQAVRSVTPAGTPPVLAA